MRRRRGEEHVHPSRPRTGAARRRRGRALAAPSPPPAALAAGAPGRRGRGQRGGTPGDRVRRGPKDGPHREAERHHQVEEHVDGEKQRVAERAAHAVGDRLRQRTVERNLHLQVPGDDQPGEHRARGEVGGEQRPPLGAGTQHRRQHHREREPVRLVHHPLHALVGGPEASLETDPGPGGEQGHGEPGAKQEEQPGTRGRYRGLASASTAHSAKTISMRERDHTALPTMYGKMVPVETTNGVSSRRAMPARTPSRSGSSAS